MSAVKVILALSLALVLSLTLVGCKEGEVVEHGEGVVGEEGLTQAEIDQIIGGVTTAEFDTVRMSMVMAIAIEIIGGPDEGEIDMALDGTGVMDIANREMQMTMNIATDIPEMDEQAMVSMVYLVDEWIYTGVDMPELGEQWFKMEAVPGMWERQSQLEQQIEFLRSAVEVNSLPDEAVDGTDCYVFEIVPSLEALSDLLNQQASGAGGVDFSQMDISDLFEEMAITEWVAKDSYQVLKTEVYMRMQMRPEDVGATEADFDRMVMDMDMTMRLYDYNQPVSIELPPKALDAMEIPS